MANYAETLVYWYLRLNGFFPIAGFVLHDDAEETGPAPDCDLLAVRLHHTSETVGGGDLDEERLFRPIRQGLGANIAPTLGVIVQVKGGTSVSPKKAFTGTRIENAVLRLGFFPSAGDGYTAIDFARRLGQDWKCAADNFVVAKLFFSEGVQYGPVNHRTCGRYLQIPLSATKTFIRNRMHTPQYRQPKRRDWVHFQSDLIQSIIWDGPL